MGANTQQAVLDGALTKEQVRAQFSQWQNEAAYENGNSYSGDWNMARGLSFLPGVQPSLDAAETLLEASTEKWDAANAVRFVKTTRKCVKAPTFAGKNLGANKGFEPVYVFEYPASGRTLLLADPLSPSSKSKLSKQLEAVEAAKASHQIAANALMTIRDGLTKETFVITAADLAKARKAFFVTQEKLQKAEAALAATESALRARLYRYNETKAEAWMLYAVCAS